MNRTGWRMEAMAALLIAGSLAGAAEPTPAERESMYQEAQKTRQAGKYREALVLLDKSLKIHEKALRAGAVEIGNHYYNYAYCFGNMKEWRKCVETCAKAQAIYRNHLKADHKRPLVDARPARQGIP